MNYPYLPVARHTAERLSSQTVSLGLIFILTTLGLDMNMTNVLQTYLMDLPNSRTQEREGELHFFFTINFEIHVPSGSYWITTLKSRML